MAARWSCALLRAVAVAPRAAASRATALRVAAVAPPPHRAAAPAPLRLAALAPLPPAQRRGLAARSGAPGSSPMSSALMDSMRSKARAHAAASVPLRLHPPLRRRCAAARLRSGACCAAAPRGWRGGAGPAAALRAALRWRCALRLRGKTRRAEGARARAQIAAALATEDVKVQDMQGDGRHVRRARRVAAQRAWRRQRGLCVRRRTPRLPRARNRGAAARARPCITQPSMAPAPAVVPSAPPRHRT
jgi:hypothetical protein